jgi:hypothetical protein
MARTTPTHSGVTTFAFTGPQQHKAVAVQLLQDGKTWADVCPRLAHLLLTDAKFRAKVYGTKPPKDGG